MSEAPANDYSQGLAIKHEELRTILMNRGQSHGGFEGYTNIMQILLNVAFAKKLKKPLSKREVKVLMLMHETARIVTGNNEANDVDFLLDIASNSLLKAKSKRVQRVKNEGVY